MQAFLLTLLLVTVQQDEIVVESSAQERIGDLLRASGDVVVAYRDLRVEAGSIVYNEATRELKAGGPVTFIRGEERLAGRDLDFDLDTMTGVLREASGELAPGFLIEAAEVHRLENGDYELLDVTVTTCDDEGRKGWDFHTSRMRVDPDDRVQASSAVFRIQGVPVFYLPYLSAPVETKPRSSGFLTPQTSTSTTKGRSISESFYYVINRSADLTLTAEYFTLRGLAGGVDFRAVPDENSRIEIDSIFADDRLGQGGQSTQILAYTQRDDLHAVADMNIVSSFVFRQVFEEGFDVISSPREQSLAFVTYDRPGITYNLLYSRLGTFFVDQPTAILRKFPSFEMAMHARPLGDLPLYWSFDGSAAGVHRRDREVASASFVGRVDLHPRLEFPIIRGPAMSWSHRLGLRNTFYTHSERPRIEQQSLNRFSIDYGFEFAGPQLERQFDGWKHVFEPHVEYRFLTGIDRFNDILLVDDADLVADTNEVRYGITNRIFTDREILSWTVAQKYFNNPTFGGALVSGRDNVLEPLLDLTGFGFADTARKFSPLVSLLRFSPGPGSHTGLQVDYDTRRGEFRSAGLIGGYQAGLTFYNAAYFFTRRSAIQLPSNQIRGTVGFGSSSRPGLNAAVSFAYNFDQAFFQASTAQVSYNTDCYGFHVEFMQFDVGPRRESRIRFSFSLKHVGSIGTLRRQEQLF